MTIDDPAAGATTESYTAGELIAHADLASARRAITGASVRTPTLACAELTELAGTAVMLKAECLQVTGSFKLRGALSKAKRCRYMCARRACS